jgi:hypothetical protein
MKVSILGYETNIVEPWDNSTPMHRSLPGSEEAVVYLSKELVNIG